MLSEDRVWIYELLEGYMNKKVIEVLAQVKSYCENHPYCTYCVFYQKDYVGNGKSCILHGDPDHWRGLNEESL